MSSAAPRECGLDPYQPYRRTLLSPQRVRELSRLSWWRPVLDTAACWVVIVACWLIVARWPRWWTILPVIPIIGARYYALLIVGHDAIHRRLFESNWANDLFADLFVFGPIGAVTRINNQNHLRHHRYLSTSADPDLHQFTCSNKYEWPLLLGYLTGVTSAWKSVRKVFGSSPADIAGDAPEANGKPRYTARDLLILGGWQLLLIGGLSWSIGLWAWPVLWLVPIYCFAFLPDNFRAFAEHSQMEPDVLADRHRLITFVSNPVERFFVAPLGMNFHAAHHLWPSVPYYHLAAADAEMRQHAQAADLEWRGSYFGYLWRYYRALPLVDCRPPAQQPTAAA